MDLLATIQRIYRQPLAAVITLPRFHLSKTAAFAVGERARWRLALLAAATGLAAIIVYVAAVNVLLLSGEAIKKETAAVATLERQLSALRNLSVERQSPSRLQASAIAHGMVKVVEVRYLITEKFIALSRPGGSSE